MTGLAYSTAQNEVICIVCYMCFIQILYIKYIKFFETDTQMKKTDQNKSFSKIGSIF